MSTVTDILFSVSAFHRCWIIKTGFIAEPVYCNSQFLTEFYSFVSIYLDPLIPVKIYVAESKEELFFFAFRDSIFLEDWCFSKRGCPNTLKLYEIFESKINNISLMFIEYSLIKLENQLIPIPRADFRILPDAEKRFLIRDKVFKAEAGWSPASIAQLLDLKSTADNFQFEFLKFVRCSDLRLYSICSALASTHNLFYLEKGSV